VDFVFTFLGEAGFQETNVRTQKELEPYGCLGDLGWYCVRYTLHLTDHCLPISVTGRTLQQTKTGTPIEFRGEMIYPGGAKSTFLCSFLAAKTQTVTIVRASDDVEVCLNDFVNATCGDDRDVTFTVGATQVAVLGESACYQERQLWRSMERAVRTKKADEHWHQLSLRTQQVLDALFESAARNGAEVRL